MINSATFLQYGAIALTAGLALVGAALSQGAIGKMFLHTSNIQPMAHGQLNRAALLAMVFAETAAILSATIIVIVLFAAPKPATMATGIALFGIVGACGLSSFTVSMVSALPARRALEAIAHQPFFAPRIMNLMLLTMSIIQTPAIFGFLVALIIVFSLSSTLSIADGWRLCAAGLSIGLGAIGPAIGQGIFSRQACQAVGINRNVYRRILSFALLSQTIIETPIIFSFLVALLILGAPQPTSLQIIALMAAASIMGICATTPGISSGCVAATACKQIGLEQGDAASISRTALLAQGLIDTLAIYGLLVSILLIYL